MVNRIGAHRLAPMAVSPVPSISSLVSFAKEKIALAPNNPSAWNYLRGVLDHARVPYLTQAPFVRQYIVDTVEPRGDDILDLENPPPSEGAELPCAAAIEFMADVHEASGKDGISKAVEVGNANVGNERHYSCHRPFLLVMALARRHPRYHQEKVQYASSAVRDPIMFIYHVSGTGNTVFVMQSRLLAKPNSVPPTRDIIILVRRQCSSTCGCFFFWK